MAAKTKIEWADSTVNLWEGCQRVSPACDHCYAEARNLRYAAKGSTSAPNWGPHAERRRVAQGWKDARRFQRAANDNGGLDPELGRKRRVFVNSLADFFDNHRSVVWREEAWQLIRDCPDVVFMLLTKRPQNIPGMLPPDWGDGWPNVWIGTTVENQTEAERRIPHLVAVPAAIRFLSCEPLLGPVDLTAWLSRLQWVIVGGESGAGARPMHPEWLLSLRDQCKAARVAFFFKQWGSWLPGAWIDRQPHRCIALNKVRGDKGPRSVALWPDGYVGNGRADDHGGPGVSFTANKRGTLANGMTPDHMLHGVKHQAFPLAA